MKKPPELILTEQDLTDTLSRICYLATRRKVDIESTKRIRATIRALWTSNREANEQTVRAGDE